MPAPLLWLGAGVAASLASKKIKDTHRHSLTHVGHYPGESQDKVAAVNGALVCCGIYGAFDHTGIWVDGSIIELRGNGLIRAVSEQRFLHNRSGSQIHILCDQNNQPLVSAQTTQRAIAKLYQYSDYHVIKNNCHRFCWQCVSGQNTAVVSFHDLNQLLHRHFNTILSWHRLS